MVMFESNAVALAVEKWYGMWTQDDVDNDGHSNCLALQPSPSSGHPLSHPKPSNCPHQIDLFPACSNPNSACLCGDKAEFCHQHY